MNGEKRSPEEERRMWQHARVATYATLAVLVLDFALAGAAANKDAAPVAIAMALAFAAIGFLIGIIFGVRRGTEMHGTTTMLEVLGDWMSKILVGLTLTNLVAIPGEIKRLAAYFAHQSEPSVGSEAMVAAIAVGAFTSGLLFGYMAMRFYLAHAFAGADARIDATFGENAAKVPQMQAEQMKVNPETLAAATAIAKTDTKDEMDPQRLAKVASAKAVLNDNAGALDLVSRAVGLAPKDEELRLDRAVILTKERKHGDAMSDLSIAMRSDKADVVQRAVETMMFNYLYTDPPHGFEEALRVAETAIQKSGPKSAAFFIYLGAAYGQKYRYEKEKGAVDKDLQAIREKALDATRAGLSLDKNWKGIVAEMLAEGGDDDLSAFKDDKAFTDLVAV